MFINKLECCVHLSVYEIYELINFHFFPIIETSWSCDYV